jgi:hypothetical protein
MSEPAQRPRTPVMEIASDEDLRKGLGSMLTTDGYAFNELRPSPGGDVAFEAWKLEAPEQTRLVITMTAGTADEGTIAHGLASLGWYRKNRGISEVRAWVIAKDFTPGAIYAALVCHDHLTLKGYCVELFLRDDVIISAS